MPQLTIVKLSDTPTPKHATAFSAGMDLHAVIDNDQGYELIYPQDCRVIGTGLLMQPEEGYCVKLYPRSGLAAKLKLTLGNSVGTIDRDYTEEVMAIMQNNGNDTVKIHHGERICQMEMRPVVPIEIMIADELPVIDSDRVGGFGSTGK